VTALDVIEVVLPDRRLAIAELPEYDTLSETDRRLVDGFGIDRVAVDTAEPAELAGSAVRRLLATAGITPDEISALIVLGSRAPRYLVASEATRIQHASGLTRALSFTITDLGCATVSAALLAARAMVRSTPDCDKVVIAHGCRPAGSGRIRIPVTVNGDGGLAVLVTARGRCRLVDIAVETDGRYHDLFRVDYRDRPTAEWTEVCSDHSRYSFQLAVESRNRLARLNERILERQGLRMSDVDHVVMQNVSVGAYRFYEDALDVSIANVCRANLTALGHLGPVDVLANLASGIASEEFGPGDLVLVMNNSPAAAWSSMLVEV
jgi:3-oxoacyl-[acyl-carrier-protein] synthase III